jgi:hypothetical protein
MKAALSNSIPLIRWSELLDMELSLWKLTWIASSLMVGLLKTSQDRGNKRKKTAKGRIETIRGRKQRKRAR